MSQGTLYLLYAALALCAAGVYLLMPSTSSAAQRLRRGGIVFGLAGILGVLMIAAGWIAPASDRRIFFVIFALIALVSAVRVISHPKPVYCALYFLLVVLAVTGLCILAAAEFLGFSLVIVYAGAILVTYVFVIMLAQQAGISLYDRAAREPLAAIVMGFVLVAATTKAMVGGPDPIATQIVEGRQQYRFAVHAAPPVARHANYEAVTPNSAIEDPESINPKVGNVQGVGMVLMTDYVVAVEVAGVLLLVAMVGAIAIAQKRLDPATLTAQERHELSREEDLGEAGRNAAPF